MLRLVHTAGRGAAAALALGTSLFISCMPTAEPPSSHSVDVAVEIDGVRHEYDSDPRTGPAIEHIAPAQGDECQENWRLFLFDPQGDYLIRLPFEARLTAGVESDLSQEKLLDSQQGAAPVAYLDEAEQQVYGLYGGTATLDEFTATRWRVTFLGVSRCTLATVGGHGPGPCEAVDDGAAVVLEPAGDWEMPIDGLCYPAAPVEDDGPQIWCVAEDEGQDCEDLALPW